MLELYAAPLGLSRICDGSVRHRTLGVRDPLRTLQKHPPLISASRKKRSSGGEDLQVRRQLGFLRTITWRLDVWHCASALWQYATLGCPLGKLVILRMFSRHPSHPIEFSIKTALHSSSKPRCNYHRKLAPLSSEWLLSDSYTYTCSDPPRA